MNTEVFNIGTSYAFISYMSKIWVINFEMFIALKTLRDAIVLQSWRFCIVFFQQHAFFVDIYFNLLKNIFDISFIACERLCLEKLFCLVIEKQIHSFYGGPRVKIQQSKSPLHWIINEEIRLMLLCKKKASDIKISTWHRF